jgi:Calx-beta domain
MATPFNGSLGQIPNYSDIEQLKTQWPIAARNQGIKLFGLAFDGVETDYLDPAVISNLTFATNENPKSWLSYGSSGGVGVPSSYDGWFTDPGKIRAEINHDPNTNQSQALKVKWADNQNITSATIDLSALSPTTSPGVGDQGNEVGFLEIFNNGVLVPATNFTISRIGAPSIPNITVASGGVTFSGDRTDGNFTFNIIPANPSSSITFDELRFSAKSYNSLPPSTGFKTDSSDYLVRKIEYQGTEDPISLQFSAPTFSVNENGTPVAAVTVTRTGSSVGTASATVNLTNANATAPGDYNNVAIPVNFANGDTAAKIITVPIVDDTLVEGSETVNLSLANPTGSSRVTLGTQSTATLTIADNDIPGSLQFSTPTFSVNEDGTTSAAVTVTRTGGSAGAVSATVNLANGTALAPDDYNNAAIPVNFADGDTTSKTVTVPIVNDTLVEGNETVNLSLVNPTGNATIGSQSTASLNIADNDSTLQFSAPTFSVNEDGTTSAAVTVTRTGSTTGAASATVNLANGTALAPGDYNNAAIPVNFATGETTKTVNIPIVNDTVVESTETVNLTLGSPTNATIGGQSTATLNIADNDSTLQFSAPTFSVNEDGTPVAAVTVTRTGSTTGAASATVNLANGTAVAPDDYNNAAIPVNFATGETTKTVNNIPIVNDTLVEGSETVNLTLGSPTGATIGTQNAATLNITDNDSTLQFSAPTFSVNEDGTPVAAVTVTRTGSTTGTASATVNIANGTAVAPGDYNNAAIPVNFATGETTKTVNIPIVNDTLVEGSETVNLTLVNPTNATIGTQNAAALNITDNDSTLQFSAPTFSVNEDGTTSAAVTVTRTGSTTGTASATVNLANGTALAPGDYNNAAIPVNFATGETTKTVNIPIVDDTLVEGSETVNLTLVNPTNATIGTQNAAALNIADNDSTLQFSAPTFSVNEDGTTSAAVTVTRTGSAGAVSATVNLANGTALAPDDYNNAAIPVNFADGDTTSKTVTVPIVNDTLVEGNETVNLSLVNPTGNATIGSQSTAGLNIADNDSTLQFSAPTFSVNEDGTTSAAVTVTRTGSTTGTASATVNLANGTAVAPGDYNNAAIPVNFATGETTRTVTVPIVNDTLVEGSETVSLTLGSPTNATIGTQNAATLNITDNDVAASKPVVSVNSLLDPIAGEPFNPEGEGLFEFTRTGDLSQPLTIRYTVTGTATPGLDYDSSTLTGTVTIDAGESASEPVIVNSFFDFQNEPTESVIVKVAEDPAYQVNRVGSADTASVSILDDSPLIGTSPDPVLLYNSNGFFVGGFSNITNAVAVSSFNDIIVAKAGTYNEPGPIVINQPLTVRGPNGGISPSATRLPEAVVRTTALGQPVFRIAPGVSGVTIEGLTILTRGGIRLQDSSLSGGLTLGTVDVISNFITNSGNGVAIATGIGTPNVRINDNNLVGNSRAGVLNNRSVPVDATQNWWDSPTGPIVGGTGPNHITGVGANLVAFNPFATSVL